MTTNQVLQSLKKSSEIKKITKLYQKKNRIEDREYRKHNIFYSTAEITNEANSKLLQLIHQTPPLENIISLYHVSDEIVLDLQAFLNFMGGSEIVNGHMMTVSPFCFPQTLDFILRNRRKIRKNQNSNMDFYYSLHQWFEKGLYTNLRDIN